MTDYIDRQAAIDAMSVIIDSICEQEAIDALYALPSAEVEPVKHGRWIVVSDGYGNSEATACICECSECKDTIWVYKKSDRKWKYCPNCGAKMDAEEGEPHEQN